MTKMAHYHHNISNNTYILSNLIENKDINNLNKKYKLLLILYLCYSIQSFIVDILLNQYFLLYFSPLSFYILYFIRIIK